MNYFSHFYALPNHRNKYLTIGNVLPDFLRNTKRETTNLLAIDEEKASPFNASIVKGFKYHLELDKLFHNSSFFQYITTKYSKEIREHNHISLHKYTFFFVHILVELLIDYELIKENKALLDQYYHHIESVDADIMYNFLTLYFPNHDVNQFMQKKNQFVAKQFLYQYTSVENVFEFTCRLYESVTKRVVKRMERRLYYDLINHSILPEIKTNMRNLFAQLKTDI